MSSGAPSPHDSTPQSHPAVERMTVRRAPNLKAFLVTGAAVGAIVGLLVGALGPGSLAYTRGAIIGFFLIAFLVLGGAVGAVVGLLLDLISVKRSRSVSAKVEDVHADGDHARS